MNVTVPHVRRRPSRSGEVRPKWTRPALAVLLVGTALLYLWDLGESGWANAYYSAAVQAGSQSWTAFFYGSFDAANAITVDKTPACLWLMALSVRLFGLNAWSVLVPQALLGVGTVAVLYATVSRWYGPAAGLIAGTLLALTPVAVLMFRFNNPDALLVFLLTAAAYATVRALENASTRWLVLAGALVGFGFLTKMLQAFLVVPVLAGVYLVAAPTGPARRVRQLLAAGLGLVAAAGWWVAIVELVPEHARPYVGGSQGNSVLELTLGYNGLGRLTGEEVGSVGPPGGGPFAAQTGLLRMFDTEVGGQVSWLLPAALILLAAGLVSTARAARTDRTRAGLLLWGGWLLVTGVVFSLMNGIFHAYYTVALAPAVGALVGIGVTLLWRQRAGACADSPTAATPTAPTATPAATAPGASAGSDDAVVGAVPATPAWRGWFATGALAATVAVTTWWSWTLLGRSPDWYPWLRSVVLVAGLAGTLLVLVAGRLPGRWGTPLVSAVGAVALLGGPVAYAVQTAATPHGGSIPSAGPAVQPGGGPGRMRGGMLAPGNGEFPARPTWADGPADDPRGPAGLPRSPGAPPPSDTGQVPDGPVPGDVGGAASGGAPGGTRPGGPAGGRAARGGGMGGLLNAAEPGGRLRDLLEDGSDDYTWMAATVGANNAAGYQLATGRPVMAVGGFNGSDPSPTLAQFQRHVADGEIRWFVGGGGFRANGGSDAPAQIAAWVAANFEAQTVDGVTVYDLSSGRQGGG